MERGVFGFYLKSTFRNVRNLGEVRQLIAEPPSKGFLLLVNRNRMREISELTGDRLPVVFEYRPQKRTRSYLIIGSEKYLSGTSLRGNRSDPAAPPVGEKAADGDSASSASYLDLGLDQSFKYPNEDDYMNLDTDAPFMSLYYPPEVQKHIDHARQWMNAQDWYATRDIPWRLGWLLEGPPGTGKSSLVRAVGQTLGLPIYDFKLGTLSDQEFIENWRGLSTPCIVLFEDIDNVFDKRESLTDHRSLSFDTVLNTISGVNLVNGVFLIVTTNHLEKIDPALGVNDANTPKMSTRPGRVDVVIRLGNLDEAGRYQVARRILQDWPITIAGLVNENTNVTPAQFQELCVEAAFQQMQADRDRREREIVLGAIGGSQTVGQQTRTEGATYSL
jgi:hypothetical protein